MPEEKFQTKEACGKNMEIVILKFEKALSESISKIQKSFSDSLNNSKDLFASKKQVESLSEEVQIIKKTHEKRQYDWFKYAITTAITILTLKFFK